MSEEPVHPALKGITSQSWQVRPEKGFGNQVWRSIITEDNRPVIVPSFFERTKDDLTETHCGVQMSEEVANAVKNLPMILRALVETHAMLSAYKPDFVGTIPYRKNLAMLRDSLGMEHADELIAYYTAFYQRYA